MIVYSVSRSWFAMKADAEIYRKKLGLKPDATLTLNIAGRDDLCALLNALCEPQQHKMPETVGLLIPERLELVERAFVPVDNSVPDCVPDFLLRAAGLDPAKVVRSPL